MATLTVQQIARSATGLLPAYAAAAAGGDQFPNDGPLTFFHMKNTNGAGRTVTFATSKTVEGLAVADLAVALAATTGDVMVGPFPAEYYNDINGMVQVTYPADAGVTVAAIRL